MSVPEILKTVGQTLQSSASVKNVYEDPISAGNRTVIPVARVSYAFGGGGGSKGGEQASGERGGGGGGHMSAVPAGLVEITTEGTRFVSFLDWRKSATIAGISFIVGLFVGAQRRRL